MRKAIILAIITVLVAAAPAVAKKKEEKSKGQSAVLAKINGEPVTKDEWSEIMKANQWYAQALRAQPGFHEKMMGKPNEDFFFTEEVVKIKAMAQKYQDSVPGMKSAIDALYERAKAGEDFAALAEAESQDEATGKNGGDLGSLKEFHEMVFPFNRIVMKLKQGEISEPFMTIFGYHIAQVEEIHPPVENKGKRVKVRHILIRFPSADPRNEADSLASNVEVEVLDQKLCKKLPTYCATES